MRLPFLITMFSLLLPSAFAADKHPAAEPFAWGMLTQNTGCVIFEEGFKNFSTFQGVDISTKSIGKLTVIETQNYTMNEKQILETQENMDAMNERARKDHVKFVKIPKKYSPELLEKARASCKQDQAQPN